MLMLINHFLSLGGGATASTADVTNLTNGLRTFLAPVVMFIISAVSISFLLKREIKKFTQFAILTVGVGIFFYVPNIVEGIARMIAGLFS